MSDAKNLDLDQSAVLEEGRLLFERECFFVAGATNEAALPALILPEIAFAGRSNVGKSSLINALTRQTKLARTSQNPGRTQQINFFELRDRLMLVDLPGYGFARASKTRVAEWTSLIHAFLRGRPNLRRVCILVDSRHGLKPNDEALMAELDEAAVVYQFVLTKIDKTSDEKRAVIINRIRNSFNRHPAAHPEIHQTSAENNSGIKELRASLATLAVENKLG
jgi:GTP-binding protein